MIVLLMKNMRQIGRNPTKELGCYSVSLSYHQSGSFWSAGENQGPYPYKPGWGWRYGFRYQMRLARQRRWWRPHRGVTGGKALNLPQRPLPVLKGFISGDNVWCSTNEELHGYQYQLPVIIWQCYILILYILLSIIVWHMWCAKGDNVKMRM